MVKEKSCDHARGEFLGLYWIRMLKQEFSPINQGYYTIILKAFLTF